MLYISPCNLASASWLTLLSITSRVGFNGVSPRSTLCNWPTLKIGVAAFNGALNITLKKRSSWFPLVPSNAGQIRLPYMFIYFFGRVGFIEIHLITKAWDLPGGFVRRDIAFVGLEIRDGQAK